MSEPVVLAWRVPNPSPPGATGTARRGRPERPAGGGPFRSYQDEFPHSGWGAGGSGLK